MSQIGRFSSLNAVPETITGNSGGAVGPTLNNINLIGAGGVDVAGNPGTSTLTISLTGAIAATYTTDAGNAVPALGVLNVLGGGTTNIHTTGAGNTVTVALVNSPSIIGNLIMPNTNSAGTQGVILWGADPYIHNFTNGGTNCFFAGRLAGNISVGSTGSAQTGVGYFALGAITTGSNNTALGAGALGAETTGSNNVGIGATALSTITTGAGNIGLGAASGSSLTGADSNNILVGNLGTSGDSGRIRVGTSGTHLTCFIQGIASVVVANTNLVTINTVTGQLGSQAVPATGVTSLTGTANQITVSAATGAVTLSIPVVFIAPGTIAATTTVTAGTNLVSTAGNLLLPTTSSTVGQIQINAVRYLHAFGTANTFVGDLSGNFTLNAGAATANTAVGKSTLLALTTGASNTAVGYLSSTAITSGQNNVSMGYNSLLTLQTGINNTAIGYEAMKSATNDNNVAVGNDALFALTSGPRNTAIGTAALPGLLTGNNNIGIGYQSGQAWVGAESNNIIVGSCPGTAAESGVIRIGFTAANATLQTKCFLDGVASVVVANTNMVTINTATGQMGSQAVPTSGLTWTVTTVDASLVKNNGYIANKAGLLTMTLPVVAAVGDTFRITGINTAVGWRIAQNGGQTIYFVGSASTTGAAGYLESTAIRDSAEIVCVVANTDFNVISSTGNLTIL